MVSLHPIHQKIFELLDKKRNRDESENFRFTLRQTNRYGRLEKGYWFHGNDNYVFISFWSGMDWRNKTPSIGFVVTSSQCYLEVNVSDSSLKRKWVEQHLLPHVDGIEPEYHRYKKYYADSDTPFEKGKYSRFLEQFLEGDYEIIDQKIRQHGHQLKNEQSPLEVIDKATFNKLLERRNWWAGERKRLAKQKLEMPDGLIEIHIKDFLKIKKCKLSEIPGNTRCIVLTGENGAGKSSILKAIALALVQDGNYLPDETDDEGNLINQFSFKGKMNSNWQPGEFEVDRKSFLKSKRKNPLSTGFAAYGPFRLEMDSQSGNNDGKEAEEQLLQHSPNDSLFRYDVKLLNFDRSLQEIIDPHMRYDDYSVRRTGLKETLQELIPNLTEFATRDKHPVFYFSSDDYSWAETKKLDDLASGSRNVIIFLNDLFIRLFQQQPDCDDISKLAGIVIIDEIDLHLHPKFQRILVKELTAALPRVQFIFTTHSPVPILGVPKESVFFVVKYDSSTGVDVERLDTSEVRSLTPNSLLTSSIFGMNDILNVDFDEEMAEDDDDLRFMNVKSEDSFGESIQNRERLAALLRKYKMRKEKEAES